MHEAARHERMVAAHLPPDNVVAVLYEQHARIRDLFDEALTAPAGRRAAAFDALRELLAAHEAAEEVVLRPLTERLLPAGFIRARDDEERQAARELAELERMDVADAGFMPRLRLLEEAVSLHAAHEEAEEFPAVLGELSEHEQRDLGLWLTRAARLAPGHPHPALAGSPVGQTLIGPFAALYDRARDRLAAARQAQTQAPRADPGGERP